MINQQGIIDFCNNHNYDLRQSHNGRWIDQKCTPDVIWSIADFVLYYVDNVAEQFTVKDIWQSDYAKETIAETYSKPGTDERTAENEYDKVFSQPLCMFCYAGIIRDISTTNRHLYEIENRDVLEYIARNDVYSLRFLYTYIEKVLRDSEIYCYFEEFFNNQDKTRFNVLKEQFINFYHEYTPIKRDFEPKRIFTKVLNPLAFKNSKKGTERGRMSPHTIVKADMMYNRDNFRDVYRDKPKDVSRQDWLAQNPEIDRRDGYFNQMMSHAKRMLRSFNDDVRGSVSELTQFSDEYTDNIPATQMHHIFPKNEFPDIMYYIENLIALTPNQHFNFAHPNNNTQVIDIAAQKVLLIAKTHSIQKNLTDETEDDIYEFSKFLFVLATGWSDDSVLDIEENDYTDVLHTISYHYSIA